MNPTHSVTDWISLSRHCQQQKDHKQAVQVLQKALQQHPQTAQLWYELGRVQLDINHAEQALASLQKAHQLSPQQASVLSVMGRAHHDLFQFEEAIRCYQQALQLAPKHAGLWSDLGNIWRIQENLDQAEACYQRSLDLDPHHAASRANQYLVQLIRNQPEGWQFVRHLRANKSPTHQIPGTQAWDGVIRPERPLAIIQEYGRGDLIQMLRFVPRLIAAGQPCMLYSRHPGSWPRLLKSMAVPIPCYEAEVWQQTALAPYFVYDSDLPTYFGCPPHGDQGAAYFFPTEFPELPKHVPYASRVGLVWASGEFNSNRRNAWSYQQRSLRLTELAPLIQAFPNKQFYSFQLGADASQIHDLVLPITDLQDLIRDFYDTAGLLQQMDLVITVDTAVAHLAGALGRPTCLLLSTGPDWRWGLHSTSSDWYPSLRLFRQSQAGDWSPVIQKLIQELMIFS